MQQATVNLFADMGAQPATLMSGLTAATAVDRHDPADVDDHLARAGATAQDGNQVTISGTATDAGGGVVAGVEVSTDGGTTWHPATSRRRRDTVNWTYTWIADGMPEHEDQVARGRRQRQPGDAVRRRHRQRELPVLHVGQRRRLRPPTDGDPSSVEVGMKFQSSVYGTVTGIRFYKAAGNTGTHIGSLWTAERQLLAQVTFTNETASGWQTRVVREPGHDHAEHHLRRVATSRPTDTIPATRAGSIRRRRPRPPAAATTTTHRCPPCPTTPAPTACLPIPPPRFPDEHVPGQQLLGRRQLHGRRPPRAR